MMEDLCLRTLGELDNGAAALAIDAAIRAALLDLEDRGKDGKSRTVQIHLVLAQLDNGQPVAGVEVSIKAPARRTAGTIGNFRVRDGQPSFQFQSLAPAEPDQLTFEDHLRQQQQSQDG